MVAPIGFTDYQFQVVERQQKTREWACDARFSAQLQTEDDQSLLRRRPELR